MENRSVQSRQLCIAGHLTIDGVEQVVCSSTGSVDGYDVDDGHLLWTFDEIGGNTANTPKLHESGTILIGASPGMHDERMESAQKSNLALKIEKGADGFQTRVLDGALCLPR